MGDAGQKKVLAAYQSEYVRRIAKMGVAAAGKGKVQADDDSGSIIELKTIRDNARAAMFATWDPSER
jgi:hypothetical protein